MNLQSYIPRNLWGAIITQYESKEYANAISEAFIHLSEIIRDRAGVDGDGANLVGQALGGELPRLKLNALQTESERNIQKGFEQIIRGLYIGVRNPRSHGSIEDSKETADSIIHFIGYVETVLNASKEAFTIDGLVERLSEADFVESARYGELIVAEIPKLRMADAAIAVYRTRRQFEFRRLKFFAPALIGALEPNQLAAYLSVVSDDLRSAADDAGIRSALQMLTPDVWPSISEISRLRIENKIIAGIREGEVQQAGRVINALSTWGSGFLKSFVLKKEAADALIGRLQATDPDARNYVARFFMHQLHEAMASPMQENSCIRAIVNAVKADDENVRQALIKVVHRYPAHWQKELASALVDFTDPNNPAVKFDDGTPFLSSPVKAETDDIPF